MQNRGETGKNGYSFISCIMGGAMVGVGYTYRDNCPNGAATYLFGAGIIILVTYLLGMILSCSKKCAEKDGEVSCMESCGLCFLNLVNALLLLADLVTLIWGSIVVFGAYSGWKAMEVPEDKSLEEYCDYTAFVFAFVILILRWVLVPFLVMCTCFTICCAACAAARK